MSKKQSVSEVSQVQSVQFSTPLQRATDQSATRWSLSSVQIIPDCENKQSSVYCSASNSKVLVTVRESGHVESELLCPGLAVPKLPSETQSIVSLRSDGSWERSSTNKKGLETKQVYPRVEGRFPKIDDIYPEFDSGSTITVTISATELLDACNAMGLFNDKKGNSSVTLLLSLDNKTNSVESPIGLIGESPNTIGVLMPYGILKKTAIKERVSTYHQFRKDFIESSKCAPTISTFPKSE